MRIAWLTALGLLVGCSEPAVDLHLVRAASAPLHGQLVAESPCEDCRRYSWLGHDGGQVEITAERTPTLSIPVAQLVEAERSQSSGLYQPYCDLFSISGDSGMTSEASDSFSLAHPGAAFVAVVRGDAVDAGASVFQSGRLVFSFSNAERAASAARILGLAPNFAEVDGPTLREARESQVALVRSLTAEEFAQLVERSGLDPDKTTTDTFINAALCP